jgi:DNA-binding GntR family transcriptional regulator
MIEAHDLQEMLARFSDGGTTANAVCAALQHCIVEGAFRPGERLLSDDLATRMGVSRTPVREALRMLEAKGYVSAAPGKGLVVREYSETDLEDVFFVRALLEGAAARLAAENALPRDLLRMEEFLEDMEIANERRDVDLFRRLAGEFQSFVCETSRNQHLAAMLQDIQNDIRRFSLSTLFSRGRTLEALGEHRALFEAIKARDGDRAEEVAREHRRKTLAMRREIIRSRMRGDVESGKRVAPSRKGLRKKSG